MYRVFFFPPLLERQATAQRSASVTSYAEFRKV